MSVAQNPHNFEVAIEQKTLKATNEGLIMTPSEEFRTSFFSVITYFISDLRTL